MVTAGRIAALLWTWGAGIKSGNRPDPHTYVIGPLKMSAIAREAYYVTISTGKVYHACLRFEMPTNLEADPICRQVWLWAGRRQVV